MAHFFFSFNARLAGAGLLALLVAGTTLAQTSGVGIGTAAPNGAAALDITSSTRGLLPPRLSAAQRDAMTATGLAGGPALGAAQAGLQVYNTSTHQLNVWDGIQWVLLLGQGVALGTPVVFATAGSSFYTVPAGVSRLRVVAIGGVGGARDGSYSHAPGTQVAATVPVVPGEVLEVRVAGNGADGNSPAGGYNGGGGATGFYSGGGGGASDVRRVGANGPTGDYLASRNALLVAAGGGGGPGYGGGNGGQGGAANGNAGTASSGSTPGGGATQSGPGTAGTSGTAGSNGTGGTGGANLSGGGGGGYYGGGGGGENGGGFIFNGGGSGSSWAAASASGVAYSLGSTTPSVTLTPEYVTLNAPIDAATISNLPGTGLPAGAVAFSTGSSLVADAANLRFDNATNRLGIGTATPTARLTVAGSLALPVRNVNQAFNSYTAVFVGADDYYLRSGTGNGETGAARFSYYLPDPAAHPGRVVVLSNYGSTPAFVFTQVGGSNLNNRIYDDAGGGSPTQLLAQRRWTLQSDGGTWLVIGN